MTLTIFQKILRLRKVIVNKDFFVYRDKKVESITLGNQDAAWTFCHKLINNKSIIYSFGVGNDISFDLELIKRFGVTVHAFDPTPKAIEWLEIQPLPTEFNFHEIGLAAYDGIAKFALPENPDHVSATILQKSSLSGYFDAEVQRLKTIMQNLSHNHIDLLKIDIEGAEYDVIDEILSSGLKITQILIEFHHRFQNVGIEKSKNAIKNLRNAGYYVFSVSGTGEEISFIKN
jgi:FkbM family methyltransferase